MLGFQFGKDPNDHLRNRRKLAVLAFFYILLWPFLILAAHLYLSLDLAAVSVFLGYAGTFGSSPVVAYFLAANKGS